MPKIIKNKTAVIIVDMQEFFLKNFAPTVRNELVNNQGKFIELCVKNKLPFIVLEYKCKGIDKVETIPRLLKKIKNVYKEIIIKENNSGFTKTGLDKTLKELGIEEIILLGINAHACIQDTAISALKRGYRVATSKGLISNSYRKDMQLSRRNEAWFKKNTTFFEDPEELSKYIK